MFKVNNTTKMHWCRTGVFNVNFEHISHLVLLVFIVNFEQVSKCQLGYFKPAPLLDVLMNTSIRYAITKFESVPNQSS